MKIRESEAFISRAAVVEPRPQFCITATVGATCARTGLVNILGHAHSGEREVSALYRSCRDMPYLPVVSFLYCRHLVHQFAHTRTRQAVFSAEPLLQTVVLLCVLELCNLRIDCRVTFGEGVYGFSHVAAEREVPVQLYTVACCTFIYSTFYIRCEILGPTRVQLSSHHSKRRHFLSAPHEVMGGVKTVECTVRTWRQIFLLVEPHPRSICLPFQDRFLDLCQCFPQMTRK